MMFERYGEREAVRMERSARGMGLFFAALVAVACSTTPPPRTQLPRIEPGVRLLAFSPERKIREQLLPTDKLVIVAYDADVTVLDSPPAPKDALRLLLSEPPPVALAVVQVTQSASSLTDAGTWIETHLQGTVQQVLRPLAADERPLQVGDVVDVRVSGGEVVVDGVMVRTDDRPEFKQSQRYLLSLGPRDASGRRRNFFVAMAVDESDRLSSVRSVPPAPVGLSLSDVREVIRGR